MPSLKPSLLINFFEGHWRAEISNTNLSYTFFGSTVDMEAKNVQNLAFAMELDNDPIITHLFVNPGVDNGTLMEQLFSDTQAIFRNGTFIFETSEEGVSLMSELSEAGEALAAVL